MNPTKRTMKTTFNKKGFVIIYPEELSINEQINIINSAKTIAGFSGSALHLSIFSEPGTKIWIGRQEKPTNTQYSSSKYL